MNKIFLWLIVVVIVILLFALLGSDSPDTSDIDATVSEEKIEGDAMMEGGVMSSNVITYTDEGYSPKELTIGVGEKVTFKNESSSGMWTASAMHPTHTVYPGSDIKKCGGEDVIFDSCEQTSSGEEWSFTFNEAGEWGYHNHVSSSHFGKVIVE